NDPERTDYGIRRGVGRAHPEAARQARGALREADVRRPRVPPERQHVLRGPPERDDRADRPRRDRRRPEAAARANLRHLGTADEEEVMRTGIAAHDGFEAYDTLTGATRAMGSRLSRARRMPRLVGGAAPPSNQRSAQSSRLTRLHSARPSSASPRTCRSSTFVTRSGSSTPARATRAGARTSLR